MAEKCQQHSDSTTTDKIEESTSVEAPEDNKTVPGSTVPSKAVELSGRKPATLEYVDKPPSSVDRLPDEPQRQVPEVPPGAHESDADYSPPVAFDETDRKADTECPADNDDEDASDSGIGTQ